MSKRFGNANIVAAIVFAGVAISVAIGFVGVQVGEIGEWFEKNEKIVQKNGEQKMEKDKKIKPRAVDSMKEKELEVKKVVKKIDLKSDHIRGKKDARITIIEYSDFECPFCQRAHENFVSIVKDYDGKVNWVYRHFPLAMHEPAATSMAAASECVAEIGGDDKFWDYADALYDGKATGDEDSLVKLAVDLGVDKVKFKSCIDSDKYNDKVAASLADGLKAGVDGTPGNFVYDNKTGKSVSVIGAQPVASFKEKIDSFLKD